MVQEKLREYKEWFKKNRFPPESSLIGNMTWNIERDREFKEILDNPEKSLYT